MRGFDLARRLGYPNPDHSSVRAHARGLAGSRPASWLLARSLRRVDDVLGALTRRRLSVPGVLVGLPVVTLTTVGARTGRARTVPLVPVVTPDVLAVLGTNFGGQRTPGWVHNLRADPRSRLRYGDRTLTVRARELDGVERDDILRQARNLYAGFGHYLARAAHRHVHVFALEEDVTLVDV